METSRGCGRCWLLLAIVVALVFAIGYRLLTGAHTQTGTDGREAIALVPEDRDLVLAEMRTFLGAVQGMTVALTKEDMQTVAQLARSVGAAAVGQVPPSLMQALPLEFKKLGQGVHADFDQLALDAEQLGDPQHSLRQMGDILGKCVACHATYRFSAPTEGR